MSNVNLLTPCIFWSAALFGMNSVYADETSILEAIINEEAVDREITQATLPQEEQPQTSKTESEMQEAPSKIEANHVVTDSIDILKDPEATEDILPLAIDTQESNQQKKPPKRQRKTHYGIGYEFRNALRKAEKTQQTKPVERTEKIQSIERAEKAQRPERIERPERVERPERITRPERHNR